jgi:hypothetical protein
MVGSWGGGECWIPEIAGARLVTAGWRMERQGVGRQRQGVGTLTDTWQEGGVQLEPKQGC